MSVIISHITKTFGHQLALNDVSFEVKQGEIAGFIGPNGAGKSTLMKIILGYIPPESGEIFINGLNVIENPHKIKKITGYLPENNPLYPEMYVREYLEYAAGHYMGRKIAIVRIKEIIEATGLKPESHKKIGALSKGYRQRLGIAQALLHDPQILILDEPTSGLDPNQINEIRNLISNVAGEKTIILSTHIMQEVEAICNRVIILNNGCVVANELTGNIAGQLVPSNNTILVEFNTNPNAEFIKKITGVTQIKKVSETVYIIESSAEKDIRADIFNYAVTKGLTVLSLQKKEKKLEEVFREITKDQ